MRRIVLIGIGVAALAGGGVALAQMPPPGPGGDGPRGPMEGDGRMGMEHRPWHHHRPWMTRGTTFRFKKGDAEVSISCSEREAVQACVTGASALLDKLGLPGAAAKP